MATITVPGDCATIAAAVAAAKEGDVLRIGAGQYHNDFPQPLAASLTILAVGGRVRMTQDPKPASDPKGKGFLVVGTSAAKPTIRIVGFDFEGAWCGDGNAAGIRHQNGDLIVQNCRFSDSQMGILATPYVLGQDTVMVDQCEFSHCGTTHDGQSHNMYIGKVKLFTLTRSFSHDAYIGHLVKSRAETSVICGNRIFDGLDGSSSYAIDLPNGGNAIVTDNMIQQGPLTDNPNNIMYAAEGALHSGRCAVIAGNSFLNERFDPSLPGALVLVQNFAKDFPVILADNHWSGVPRTPPDKELTKGPVLLINNGDYTPVDQTFMTELQTAATMDERAVLVEIKEQVPSDEDGLGYK